MSYKITFQKNEDHLYCFVEGKDTKKKSALEFWLEIGEKAQEFGYGKILVEEDLEDHISMTELYEVMTEGAEFEMLGFKIAFFDRHSDHNEFNKFGETVAKNRGVDCKVFNDLKEAEDWLKE